MLSLRREGNVVDCRPFFFGGVIAFYRVGGEVRAVLRREDIGNRRSNVVTVYECAVARDAHRAVGDRTRFVKAETVGARKHFDAVNVFDESFLESKFDDAEREGDRDEKEHSRGDHTLYRACGVENGVVDGIFHALGDASDCLVVVPEHQSGKGDNGNADPLYDAVDVAEKVGFGAFEGFCRFRNGLYVTVRADFFDAGAATAADDKTACVEHIAVRFFDADRFARQETFVHFHFARQQNGVCGDLIAHREDGDIVKHEFFGGNEKMLAVSNHFDFRSGDERKTLHRQFCADFLYDGKNRIRNDDDDEKEVADGGFSHQDHCKNDGEDQCPDQVEEGADIVNEDLPQGFCVGFRNVVIKPCGNAAFDFRSRKSFVFVFRETDGLRKGKFLFLHKLEPRKNIKDVSILS